MIAILIITHGNLGESLIDTATHVLGQRPAKVGFLAFEPRDDPAQVVERARQLAKSLDDGGGVLIMSDICGATPCNVACQLIEPGRIEVVTGASLPMLLRALTYRNEPLARVVAKALSGGAEGVMQMQVASPNATRTG